jgi:hypothetical protein
VESLSKKISVFVSMKCIPYLEYQIKQIFLMKSGVIRFSTFLQEFRRKLSAAKGMAADFGQSLGSTGMSGGSSTLGSDTLGTGSSYTYTYGDTSTGTASDARRVRISNTVSF